MVDVGEMLEWAYYAGQKAWVVVDEVMME